MSLGKKLTTFAAGLVLSSAAVANDGVCPDLGSLQSAGVFMAEPLGNNYYVGFSMGTFKTTSFWGFAVGPVQADTDEDAMDVSNQILSNMTAPGVYLELDGAELCLYDTGNPYIYSFAVKGLYGVTPAELKHYLQKIH